MSWRDNHAGVKYSVCARDRNHSYSYGEGSMCAENTLDQVRARQVMKKGHSIY